MRVRATEAGERGRGESGRGIAIQSPKEEGRNTSRMRKDAIIEDTFSFSVTFSSERKEKQ